MASTSWTHRNCPVISRIALLCDLTLNRAKIPPSTHRDLYLKGKKFTPQEALKVDMVDKIVPMKDLISEGRKLAEELAPKGEVRDAYGQMKSEIYYKEFDWLTNVGMRRAEKVIFCR